MSDPEVFASLLQMPYPSVEAWRKHLEQQVEQHDSLHLLAIDNGEVIASGGIHSVGSRMRRRHVAGLGICIARERQGQGIGSEMMKRLLDWAELLVRLAQSGTATQDKRAIARKGVTNFDGT